MTNYRYLASVMFLTYNQRNYVKQALQSVVSQQADFPFVIALVDDASTDGAVGVIKEIIEDNFNLSDTSISYEKETDYANITYAQHKHNKNCYIAALYLKENHYQTGNSKKKKDYVSEWVDNSKYYTVCEGDDWWTDNMKLQKLVCFLEMNPDYVLACHRYDRYLQNENKYVNDSGVDMYFRSKNGISFGRYYNRFINWRTQTLATVYNNEILKKTIGDYPFPISDGICSYFPLKYGKGYCFNVHMATYRVNDGGVYSGIPEVDRYYGNWLMFRDYDSYEKSLFSKLSFYDSYFNILRFTKWKGYKEARPNNCVRILGMLHLPIRYMIIVFYKILNLMHL